MAKKRGLDMKLYLKTADFGAALSATPAIGSPADYVLLGTVNLVEKSVKNEEYAFVTREQADDEIITSGRTREYTVTFYTDMTDTNGYVKFVQMSEAQTTVPLLFAVDALSTSGAPNIIEAGNFAITEESSSEPKKEGVLNTFKLKPSSYFSRIIDLS